MDISRVNPSGKRWMHMIKPEKDVNLVSISAGKYNVWAISDTGLNKIILLKKQLSCKMKPRLFIIEYAGYILCQLFVRFPSYIATERYRDNVAISFCRDIVCLPNDFATNFMKYFNVEKDVYNMEVFLTQILIFPIFVPHFYYVNSIAYIFHI